MHHLALVSMNLKIDGRKKPHEFIAGPLFFQLKNGAENILYPV